MVMTDHVKVTKKAGAGEVSVAVFETYTTLETRQEVESSEKVFVLISRENALAGGREAHVQVGPALRGEDYPALVKVWDNEVDAAIYDKD